MTWRLASESANSRYDRWVAMWAAGVTANDLPMAVGDPATGEFIQLSPAAVRLLGSAANYLDVVEPQDASAELLRQMRGGLIEGARSRRRLRCLDGSTLDVDAFGWVVRSSDGPELGLGIWLPDPVSTVLDLGLEDYVTAAFPKQGPNRPRRHRLLIDERWRVQSVDLSTDVILGWSRNELIGTSILEWTHPGDLAALLFTLARSTSDAKARVVVRVCHHDGSYRATGIVPTVIRDDQPSLVALVLTPVAERRMTASAGSLTAIPGELRRIADYLENAALVAPPVDLTDAFGLDATGDLSPRQWEVVGRLLRGERVPTIAAEMHLSRSTIRNHLSAVFAKVGVHSQAELLALYRRRSDTPSQS